MRIAYQGVTGAYSEAAALRFDSSADVLPQPQFEDVFAAVAERRATHGIRLDADSVAEPFVRRPKIRRDAASLL